MSGTRIAILKNQSGTGVVEEALGRAVRLLDGNADVTVCDNEDEARWLLHYGCEAKDTPLVSFVSGEDSDACQAVFRIHMSMRVRQPGHDPWHGGLVVVALGSSVAESLQRETIYQHLTGHRVVPAPIRLLDVLAACRDVGELYPRRWMEVVELTGLKRFWDDIASAEGCLTSGSCTECTRHLGHAIRRVTQEGKLKYLVPHADVMRKMEAAENALSALTGDKNHECHTLLDTVQKTMEPYRLGE